MSLVLRDARGRPVAPEAFDSVTHQRVDDVSSQPTVTSRWLPAEHSHRLAVDSLPVRTWQAHECRIRFDTVTVWRGRERMDLVTDLRLDTYNGATARRLLIDTPPFEPGRWVLTPCGSRISSPWGAPVLIAARQWSRRAGKDARPCPPGTSIVKPRHARGR